MDLLDYKLVEEAAKELYIRALKRIPPDVKEALKQAHQTETSAMGKDILGIILKNIEVAEESDMLVCQDTGIPVYRVRIGLNVSLDGIKLKEAIRNGVRRATLEHPLRSSVCHPITRENPQTSTGYRIPVIDFDFIPNSDILELKMMPKGSGSENMTWLRMLPPAAGISGVKRFVLDTLIEAGANPCPPTIVGVGIGGTADLCLKLAKEALFRPIGSSNHDPVIAEMEQELLKAINGTGIGPMGLGGDVTALAVHIEEAHTHITMNPVAVNIQCWRGERSRARIYNDGRVEYGY